MARMASAFSRRPRSRAPALFDLSGWGKGADFADAIDVVLGAAIAQIVAIDTGDDDHVFELEVGTVWASLRGSLVSSSGSGGHGPHRRRAAACALVAHDHEGGGAVAKAFADVSSWLLRKTVTSLFLRRMSLIS